MSASDIQLQDDLNQQQASSSQPALLLPQGFREEFICPISQYLIRYPVILSDSITYEALEILNWFRRQKERGWPLISPLTKEVITSVVFNRNTFETINNLEDSLCVNDIERFRKDYYPGGIQPVLNELQEYFTPSSQAKVNVKKTAVQPCVNVSWVAGNLDPHANEPVEAHAGLQQPPAMSEGEKNFFSFLGFVCSLVTAITAAKHIWDRIQNEPGPCLDRVTVLMKNWDLTVTCGFFLLLSTLTLGYSFREEGLADCRRRAQTTIRFFRPRNEAMNVEIPEPAQNIVDVL